MISGYRCQMCPDQQYNKLQCSILPDAGPWAVQVFRGGDLDSPVDFKGPRDADGIVSYLRKQAGPAYIVLKGDTEASPTC